MRRKIATKVKKANEEIPKKETIYASLQVRLLANLVDSLIFALIMLPVISIISIFIFGDTPPSVITAEVNAQIEELSKSDPNFDLKLFLENNQLLKDYYINNNGFLKVALNFILQIVFMAGLYVTFWIKKQATIGKRLFSLVIVDSVTLDKPTTKQCFVRLFALLVSILPAFLGIIWIAFDPKKQGWHDKIAGTLVIKRK